MSQSIEISYEKFVKRLIHMWSRNQASCLDTTLTGRSSTFHTDTMCSYGSDVTEKSTYTRCLVLQFCVAPRRATFGFSLNVLELLNYAEPPGRRRISQYVIVKAYDVRNMPTDLKAMFCGMNLMQEQYVRLSVPFEYWNQFFPTRSKCTAKSLYEYQW